MQARWIITTILATGLLLLAAACGGGGETPEANETQGSVGGSISVEGALLADLGSGLNQGTLDPGKVGVRIIEPIEDIDSVEIDTSGGIFSVTPVQPAVAKLLQIELQPAVDLEGGDAASTPVLLSIPVTVEQGELTNVAVELFFEQEASVAGKLAAQAGRPWSVRMRYVISGPGAVQRELRIRWADRLLQIDSDRDGSFDDEAQFSDSDRDGLGDDYRQVIDEQARDRALIQLSGEITAIDPQRLAITLDGDLLVRFTEITQVLKDGDAARFGDLVVGDECSVRGYSADDFLLRAVEIDASSGNDLSSRR